MFVINKIMSSNDNINKTDSDSSLKDTTNENKKNSVKFTDDLKIISGNFSMGIVIFAMLVLLVYCGFLSYNIYINIIENNVCKSKPSATDASFTCSNQGSNTNLGGTDNNDYAPYYLSDTGEKIPVTTFYGAIDTFS
jgi:hypothetical protein